MSSTITFNDSIYPESVKNADLYIIKTIEAESRDMSNSGIRQKHARIRSKSNLPLLRRWFGESLATTLVNLSDEYKKQTGNAIKDTASLIEFLHSDLVKQSTHGLADENGQAFDWAGKEQELRADAEKHFSSISLMSFPLVGAHEPFSITATVRFWILWATRSYRKFSI